jgi:hypothetical protein
MGRWMYTAQMPLVPGLDVGIVPIVQMLVLPPLLFRLVAVWCGRTSGADMIDIASGCAKRTYKSDFWRNRCVNHSYFLICTQGKS